MKHVGFPILDLLILCFCLEAFLELQDLEIPKHISQFQRCNLRVYTPVKTNISPEDGPSQKESHFFATIIF